MGKKVFFKTFIITLSIMLACYGILYITMGDNTYAAHTPQKNIPINKPTHQDSATILVSCGDENSRFFFVIKFNGYQNTVSVISVSPSFVLPQKGYSLSQSIQKAGIMQCVLDIKEEFGINVDYYINCSWDGMRKLLEDFCEFGIEELGSGLPPVIKNFLLAGADSLDRDSMINAVEKAGAFLDNRLGIGFLNEGAYRLIKFNGHNLYSLLSPRLKANYSSIQTNINSRDLKKLERIMEFIDPDTALYKRQVVVNGETDRAAKIKDCVEE